MTLSSGVAAGRGDATKLVGTRLTFGGECVGEAAVFDGPEPTKAPDGGHHLLDHAELDVVGGIEARDVLVQEALEIRSGFIREDRMFCEEAVSKRVVRGVQFAHGCSGAEGEGAIGA